MVNYQIIFQLICFELVRVAEQYITVEQFSPKASKKSINSAESQTTTLDVPSKVIEEQHQAVVTSHPESERAVKVVAESLLTIVLQRISNIL